MKFNPNILNNLTSPEADRFWKAYLILLCKSIKLTPTTDVANPIHLVCWGGWGISRGNSSWANRQRDWYFAPESYAFCIDTNKVVKDPLNNGYSPKTLQLVPLFERYVTRAIKIAKIGTNPEKSKEETKPMKNQFMEKMVNKNKDAAKTSMQLATGKTANSFIISKLIARMPWWSKLFTNKKEAINSPLSKLVAAQTAMAITTHFMTDNKKLNYISEAMVTDAMVELTVNSKMLDGLIEELESLVRLPDNLGE